MPFDLAMAHHIEIPHHHVSVGALQHTFVKLDDPIGTMYPLTGGPVATFVNYALRHEVIMKGAFEKLDQIHALWMFIQVCMGQGDTQSPVVVDVPIG